MATLTGNNVIVSGTKYARIRIEWQLAGQNVGGNYSTINWQGYVDFVGCDAQLDNGHVNSNNVGALYNNGGRVYNYAGNFSNHTVGMGSGSFNVGHDGNGYQNLNMNGSVAVYQSGTSSANGDWGLPRIPKPPYVQSNYIDTYTTTSVRAVGTVSDNGGAGLSERGVCWVLGTGTPNTGNSRINVGGDTGAYGVNITGLTPNTTYTARAYAINAYGTTYGGNMQFTTYENPSVLTDSITSVAGTTATANGTLLNNGNPDITEKGFVYSTSPNPTIANSKAIVAGISTGAYSANLTGLSPSSVYYIRAYATSSLGTFYGTELSFQTVVPATVTTDAATNVTTTAATGTGTVLTDGGGTISDRGIVLSTSPNPTTANIKIPATTPTGLGAFTANITGLSPSTTYYYRAYATNQGGTAYGNQLQLSTDQTAPAQPTGLVPTSAAPLDTLVPPLAWVYNPGSANDTQKNYQIIVTRQSDSATMWDSGKVTSGALTANYNHNSLGSALSYNVVYQWKVRTWNQNDQVSPYSAISTFKTEHKPVGTLTFPADLATIASNTPTVTWTYAQTESIAQGRWRIKILNDQSVVIHDTGWVIGTATSYNVPDNVMSNLSSYFITLDVENSEGLAGVTDTNTFSVQFKAPGDPSIGATQDAAGVVHVAVDLNSPPTDGWYADVINFYKKEVGDLSWTPYDIGHDVVDVILANADSTTGWSSSGVATAAATAPAKYGTNSLGLGASGAGNANYQKTITAPDLSLYDTIQAWIYTTATNNFTSVDIKLGTDASNYFKASMPSSLFAANAWNALHIPRTAWTIVGNPNLASLTMLRVEIINATGAITSGNMRIDQIRLVKSTYEFDDYTTAAGQELIYGVSAQSTTANVSTGIQSTSPLTIAFTEPLLNIYILPPDQPELMVKAFMDGTKVPNWSDHTDTKYYDTKGSSKPTVVINSAQQYKEGSIEFRFFDQNRNGQGLVGVESFEAIKNFKPLLLRTWWGKNYYISIDGELNTARKAGIGWYTTFNFTEINL